MSAFAKILHWAGFPGYAPSSDPKPTQQYTTLCVECKRPIVSREPGQRIHLMCSLTQDDREKASQLAAAQKRERIDEFKQAMREYYGNNEGPK